MSTTKCIVTFESREFKIKMTNPASVAVLQIKLRRFLKLSEHDAIFLFFKCGYFERERLFPAQTLLSEIMRQNYGNQGVLFVTVMRENTFGAISKMFVKARIEKKKELFCAIITYNFYGLYHFDEVTIHETVI
jgi:hypothetical protein